VEIQQKYYNKWISGSLDLFGTDHSGSAQWAYAWGIKGRVDEDKASHAADREHLNERAREQFYAEVQATVDRVNEVNASKTAFYVPDMRFNRRIGAFAGKHYAADGRELTAAEWETYAPTVLPNEADEIALKEFFKRPDWIAPKGKNV
ncbi:MAG TPA: hypothetical protein VMD91_02410, partial [Candidatus Sulfotelmatobacter sp.]|nr:hypothetical protein [Candidatus Sulfotelmatobacter sp.]